MEQAPAFPLDHVGIAVASIADALPRFESILGASGSAREVIASQRVAVVFVGAGEGRLELIEPTSSDSTVARFLERRGPGLHHIAYRVADLDATLARLGEAGIRLIDRVPRAGAHGRRVAFLHPSAAAGVLVELVEATASD